MVIKRRSAVYSVIALMLCVAAYLNWSYQRGDQQINEAGEFEDPKILGESQMVDKTEPGQSEIADLDPAGDDQTAAAASDYFSQARLSRQKARDEAVSIFKQTSENQNADQQSREQAEASISAMAENALKEARIENLVVAKGYQDCVTFINDDGVNVIVHKTEQGLQAEDAARIRDIVISETEFAADAIQIIETA